MELFDKYAKRILDICEGNAPTKFSYGEKFLPVTKAPQFLPMKDSAVELGGGGENSVGFSVVTSLGIENETILIGKDLDELSGNVPFVKIVLLKVNDIEGGEQEYYDFIKKLEYIKYDVNIVGFMARASSFSMREEVRVSKKEVKKGLNFEKIGNTLIKNYLDNPAVEKVTVIFFVGENPRYDEIQHLADTVKKGQDALNHIFDNVVVDCKSCNLKTICDEVEGMREIHIKQAKK